LETRLNIFNSAKQGT